MIRRFLFAVALLFPLCIGLAACRSYHVDVTVENRTGAPVQLLEVDYPSASFGVDVLAAGGTYHYRIQVQGSGPVKVQYTSPAGIQSQIAGPTLLQNQQGGLWVVLLPAGKAQFFPQLSVAR